MNYERHRCEVIIHYAILHHYCSREQNNLILVGLVTPLFRGDATFDFRIVLWRQ